MMREYFVKFAKKAGMTAASAENKRSLPASAMPNPILPPGGLHFFLA
jgi:hypothetical protein